MVHLILLFTLLHCSQKKETATNDGSSLASALSTSISRVLTSDGTTALPPYNAGVAFPGAGPRQSYMQKPCASRMGAAHPDQGTGVCTGNLYTEVPLATLGSALVHNSLGQSLQFGYGSGFNFSRDSRFILLTPGSRALLLMGDGSTVGYHYTGSRYESDDLRMDDGYFTLSGSIWIKTHPDGESANYAPVAGDSTHFALSSVRDSNGNTISYTRNAAGNITRITDRYSNTINITYGTNNLANTITDQAGRLYTLSYDATLRLTSLTQPDGRRWILNYDGLSARISKSQSFTGNIQNYTYYVSGDLESITNQLGYQTFVYYTSNTSSVFDSFKQTVETFDTNGALASVKENGALTTITRNAYNQVLSISHASGGVTSFTYNTNDPLPSSVSYPNGGGTVLYTRDSSRRLLSRRSTQGSTVETTAFDPNQKGRVISVVAGTNSTNYTYDLAGNLTKVTRNGLIEATYTYDNAGKTLSQTNAIGEVTRYTYDSRGFNASVIDSLGRTTSYINDALGNPIEILTPTLRTTQQYDSMGEPVGNRTTVARTGSGGTVTTNRSVSYLSTGAPGSVSENTFVNSTLRMSRTTGYSASPTAGSLSSDILRNGRSETYDLLR